MDVIRLLEVLAGKIEAAPRVDLRPQAWKEWERLRHEYADLKEPSRQKIPLESLKLVPDDWAGNIQKVLDQATAEERAYWSSWYRDASGTVQKYATKHKLPLEIMAGVVAALSPGSRWWRNLQNADKLVTFWQAGIFKSMSKLDTYPAMLQKAVRILEQYRDHGTFAIEEVSTPKVSVFYNSLVDPVGTQKDLVLDGHAINVARGEKRSLKGLEGPTAEERKGILQAYADVAAANGLDVQGLQALTWFLWKNVK